MVVIELECWVFDRHSRRLKLPSTVDFLLLQTLTPTMLRKWMTQKMIKIIKKICEKAKLFEATVSPPFATGCNFASKHHWQAQLDSSYLRRLWIKTVETYSKPEIKAWKRYNLAHWKQELQIEIICQGFFGTSETCMRVHFQSELPLECQSV